MLSKHVEISLCGVTSKDMKAMATLEHIEVMELLVENEEETEVMGEMGETEGVVPFKRIRLINVRFNLTRFFSSHRCSALREIYLRDCEIPEESMKALAMNSCETLESIVIEEGSHSIAHNVPPCFIHSIWRSGDRN